MENKICKKCGTEKSLDDFHNRHNAKDGKCSYCKDCRNSYNRKKYPDRYEKTLDKREITERFCPRCEKTKSSQEFSSCFSAIDGKQSYCKDCISSYRKVPEKIEIRNTRRQYRHKNDLQYKFSQVLRGRISCALRGKTKAGSAIEDLGCSLEDLKKHLENKFLPGMTWENWGKGEGKWNIDHIIPISKFDLTDRQHIILAVNYMNLQPMWSEDNISKGAKYQI